MSDGAAESQTSWRKHRWRSSRRRWRRMWRGRRKSGYGHTAVQQIIIGFVRQHLLCQHSSRQPGGGRAKNRLQSSETDRNKARHRKAKPSVHFGHFGVHLHVYVSGESEPSAWGSQVQIPVCPAAVSLTKTVSPQADHDLWPSWSVLEISHGLRGLVFSHS